MCEITTTQDRRGAWWHTNFVAPLEGPLYIDQRCLPSSHFLRSCCKGQVCPHHRPKLSGCMNSFVSFYIQREHASPSQGPTITCEHHWRSVRRTWQSACMFLVCATGPMFGLFSALSSQSKANRDATEAQPKSDRRGTENLWAARIWVVAQIMCFFQCSPIFWLKLFRCVFFLLIQLL